MVPEFRQSTPPGKRASALLATCAAGLLASCGADGPAAPRGEPTDPSASPAEAIEWRRGDEHSFIAHRYDQQVIRCWNVQGRFDCVSGQSIGLKDIIPGAPVRLSFFRFRTGALPSDEGALDRLATSDGYGCELTRLPDGNVLTETYWRRGRIVREHAIAAEPPQGWNSADIAGFRIAFPPPARRSDTRPFFACAKVIDPVLDVGLFALDSGLVRYDAVVSSVDYPRAPAR